MLIVNSNIESGAIDIPIDIAILIEFDSDINPDSLNNANNVILYKMDSSNNITGYHNVTVSLPTSSNLAIIPAGDLSINTKYSLVIRGDVNVGVPGEGITDLIGTELPASVAYTFTTGETVSDPINIDPEEHTLPIEEDLLDDQTEISETEELVKITGTSPKIGEVINNEFNSITIVFDHEVNSITDDAIRVFLSTTVYPYDDIPDTDAAYTLLYKPTIDPDNARVVTFAIDQILDIDGITLIDSPETIFSDNIIIAVEVKSSEITFAPNHELTPVFEDYSWYFVSGYDPLYADVDQIYKEPFVAEISAAYIRQIIHEVSIELYEMVEGSEVLLGSKYWVNKYTVCKTLQVLYNKINGVDAIGGNDVISKTLGDLSIKYAASTSKSTEGDGAFGDCIKKALFYIMSSSQSGTAVKSSMTSSYPGRTRKF